jgi:CelD/BcsL family acetyltransferase involved in cellulose biosynthesis
MLVSIPSLADLQLMGSSVSVREGAEEGQLLVECVRTATALTRLAGEWRDLFQQVGCRNAFLSIEWIESWWRQWGAPHRLLVIAVRNSVGRLVAVAPFYVRRPRLHSWGTRALCFVGNDYVAPDHLNILVDQGHVQSSIKAIVEQVQQLRGEWDYIELSHGQEASPVFSGLCRELQAQGMREKVLHVAGCPYAVLPNSFEAYLGSMGSNLRYNYRRRRRALEREGRLEFVVCKSGPEIREHFDELRVLHGLRFGQKQVRSAFLLPRIQEFHADVVPRLTASGMARLYLLRMEGRTVAALYGFSAGKTFSFYQSGMDPAWSRLSIGLVMMGCAIEEAIGTGHDEFDFLSGEQAYKRQWATHSRNDVSICYFDRRVRSRLAWMRFETIRQLIRVKQEVRWTAQSILGRLRAVEHSDPKPME